MGKMGQDGKVLFYVGQETRGILGKLENMKSISRKNSSRALATLTYRSLI